MRSFLGGNMFIEMKENIGRENPMTKEVIRQALLLGVQVAVEMRGGAILVRLENATVRIQDIPLECFERLPGVFRVVPAFQLGF